MPKGIFPRPPPATRFWAKVRKSEGCWNWLGFKDYAGYGIFRIAGRKNQKAHRFAYELAKGRIPDGLQIDHLCRNTSCVNPDHMDVVSNRVNSLRGTSPWAQNARKTVCKRGHPLVEGNLDRYRMKHGERICLACSRLSKTNWEQRRRVTVS